MQKVHINLKDMQSPYLAVQGHLRTSLSQYYTCRREILGTVQLNHHDLIARAFSFDYWVNAVLLQSYRRSGNNDPQGPYALGATAGSPPDGDDRIPYRHIAAQDFWTD